MQELVQQVAKQSSVDSPGQSLRALPEHKVQGEDEKDSELRLARLGSPQWIAPEGLDPLVTKVEQHFSFV